MLSSRRSLTAHANAADGRSGTSSVHGPATTRRRLVSNGLASRTRQRLTGLLATALATVGQHESHEKTGAS